MDWEGKLDTYTCSRLPFTIKVFVLDFPSIDVPQWGTADAEIKIPSVAENPELKVSPSK